MVCIINWLMCEIITAFDWHMLFPHHLILPFYSLKRGLKILSLPFGQLFVPLSLDVNPVLGRFIFRKMPWLY